MDGVMKTYGRRIRTALIALTIAAAMTMSAFACDEYYDLGEYDDYEAYMYSDDFCDDYDYWNDPEYWTDCGYDIDCSTEGQILSYDDLSEFSVMNEDVFDFTVLPERVGSTDALIGVNVKNPSGRTVTGVGCTLYYTFGGVVKSTMLSCDFDYTDFTVAFDLNDYLDETLISGGIYDYRIFVAADGEIYTHDLDRFETNTVDDRIEILKDLCSVTATTASVDVTVYNPTGMTIDEIGCKFGEYSWEFDRDKAAGPFTDEEISKVFTMNFPDGEFISGKTYSYEVYVVAGGKTYSTGVENFKPY